MIDWVRGHTRSAIICAITLLLPALFYFSLLLGTWDVRAEYVSEIGRLEPRIARLIGIKVFENELAASSEQVQQQITRLVYPASGSPASISAALQTDVRQLMAEAGLSVSNSQVLPLREGERFDHIGVKLTVTGSVAALDEALAKLADFTPVIIIESLEAWPAREVRGKSEGESQNMTASIRLVSLRALI